MQHFLFLPLLCLGYWCLLPSAAAEEVVLTKDSVVETLIHEDSKRTKRTLEEYKKNIEVEKRLVDLEMEEGWHMEANYITFLEARIKQNALILTGKNAELKSARATSIATEQLKNLYAKWYQNVALKEGLKPEIEKYKRFVSVLTTE